MLNLKGIPIGLKAYMDHKEMKTHLINKIEEWQKKGFSDNEVKQAIITKCRPLVYGYYWHRYPDASQTLHKVLIELNIPIETKPSKAPTNRKSKSRRKSKDNDFLKQFTK